MKKYALPILALVLALTVSTGCVIVTDDATLTVVNESSFALTELYVSPVDALTYGPELLGPAGLFPGESIVLDVSCDFYDARVVDQDGIVCDIFDLDLCFNDAVWVIDNRELNSCGF